MQLGINYKSTHKKRIWGFLLKLLINPFLKWSFHLVPLNPRIAQIKSVWLWSYITASNYWNLGGKDGNQNTQRLFIKVNFVFLSLVIVQTGALCLFKYLFWTHVPACLSYNLLVVLWLITMAFPIFRLCMWDDEEMQMDHICVCVVSAEEYCCFMR